jgi:hypothetical protein
LLMCQHNVEKEGRWKPSSLILCTFYRQRL